MKSYLYFCTLLVVIALASPAHAQTRPARTNALAFSTPRPHPAAALTLAGRVETTQGPLSGAVVRLPRLNQTCVTNAEGSFLFAVPADAGPLAVVTTYPGCADVSTILLAGGTPAVVQLSPPMLTKAGEKQLKTYMKVARREMKHSLRQIR